MHGILIDDKRVAVAIGNAVVGSDCQDELAKIICNAYHKMIVSPKQPPEYIIEMFNNLGILLRMVEACEEEV